MKRILIAFSMMVLVACLIWAGGQQESSASAEDLVEVRLGALPYFDYAWAGVPDELEWDKELGIDLKLTWFPGESDAVKAMLSGSLDMTLGAIGSVIPLMPQAPELQVFLNNTQFMGFAIECRTDDTKTYYDFLEELGDQEKAIKATIQQMKGKTFIFDKQQWSATMSSTLAQGGISLDDVEILDMDQAMGAAAYIRGTGDFYTGGFPQHLKLRNITDQNFGPLLEHEQMGPAGLWFSNAVTSSEYLANNEDVILKVIALAYRTVRFMREDPRQAYGIMGTLLNEHAASNSTYEDLKLMADKYIYYATIEETNEKFFNPKSRSYWLDGVEYQIANRIKLGDLKEGDIDIDKMIVFEEMLEKVEKDDELMSFINKPF